MKWMLAFALIFLSAGNVWAAGSSQFSDIVKKVREDDEGLVVLFNTNSGSFYLRRDLSAFMNLKSKLEASMKNKKPVSVTIEPVQLNILEVK